MGTKNNPGKFDCYASAEPDEPMFILLGRDPLAGPLVRLWAFARNANPTKSDWAEAKDGQFQKITEALETAQRLEDYAVSKRGLAHVLIMLEAFKSGVGGFQRVVALVESIKNRLAANQDGGA